MKRQEGKLNAYWRRYRRGEVDIDAAAEDALEDTAAQVEEAEEAETKAQSLYLAGIEAGRRMFAEELEDIEGDIEEEQEEVKQQAYLAGIEAGRRMTKMK